MNYHIHVIIISHQHSAIPTSVLQLISPLLVLTTNCKQHI